MRETIHSNALGLEVGRENERRIEHIGGSGLGVTEANVKRIMMHFCGSMTMKVAQPFIKKEMDVISICCRGSLRPSVHYALSSFYSQLLSNMILIVLQPTSARNLPKRHRFPGRS